MSLEILQKTRDEVYASLHDERVQDLTLVVSAVLDAEREKKPMDGAFTEELADMRRAQSLGYNYPVPGTGPSLESSLRIVRDILTIRELEATQHERQADIASATGADIAFLNAMGLERAHRLREKGILRIFDQQTSISMWAIEFDRPDFVTCFVRTLFVRNREQS